MARIRLPMVPLCLALALPLAVPGAAVGQGVAWQKMDLDGAIAKARKTGKRVLVEFSASWCSSCKQLEEEVLATADGAALTRDLIAVQVDFDAKATWRHVERYAILGLPTVVVLAGGGTQVGRIMGFEGKEAWLKEARAAIKADDPMPALRKAHAANPEDGDLTLALGQALLERGEVAGGERLLEGLLWADGKGEGKAAARAAQALFVLGRYYHRVRKQPRTARFIWRALALGHPASPWAAGAWWWYARAEAEIGRHAVGLKALRGRAQKDPGNAAALRQWGDYVMRYELHASVPEVRKALTEARDKLPEAERASVDKTIEKLVGFKRAQAK